MNAAVMMKVSNRAALMAVGSLVDVSETAREVAYKYPVALTDEVFRECVEWTEEDRLRKQLRQNRNERLFNLLLMSSLKARHIQSDSFVFTVHCVPRDGDHKLPKPMVLRSVCHPGDYGEPVVTIMLHRQN